MIAVIVLGVTVVVFTIGRLACPPHDRLPMRCLDSAALVGTLVRGARVLAAAGPLSTLTAADGTRITGDTPSPRRPDDPDAEDEGNR
ncbi:hypothetical protein [Brevibacterium sp. XM4083]|uniref:hypothetical protein n=1 Tax=Brevibacterium sp. XM4083 TaxID=2583238 RepID=UPI0011284C72|nr:hypothetical protein [Brevibacterium sp. XM4083]MCM1011082.1 hypothetical protein [Brevibacterium sp. XM4083]